LLQVKDIYKAFGDNKVLNGVSLDIEQGAFVSLLGPSGCGKTTLLKVIAGLEVPESGSIFINGTCCDELPARKRGAVIVFQDYGLFPHMTVTQNIAFGLVAQKKEKSEREQKISHMLDVMQISEKANSYPHELSGGQKQRVALARACVLEPNVLLLDEPFSNLDTGLRDVMREFVQELQRKLGITTVLVTHDKEEAFMLSQKVAVIFDGSVQQYDTPIEIYTRPKTKQVSDFIGEANYIDGAFDGKYFCCPFGKFETSSAQNGKIEVTDIQNSELSVIQNREPSVKQNSEPSVKQNDKKKLMVRYDQFHMEAASEAVYETALETSCEINTANAVKCEILEKTFKGRITTYRVQPLEGLETEIRINTSNANFEQGDKVFVTVKSGAGHVI